MPTRRQTTWTATEPIRIGAVSVYMRGVGMAPNKLGLLRFAWVIEG
jgi:hypothetical protein